MNLRGLLKIQPKPTGATEAYNLWAAGYDNQPDNLVLDLENALFTGLTRFINFENKTVADVGCGTGRHWKKIRDEHPKELIGFDVSEKMLEQLARKFPGAQTRILKSHRLEGLEDKKTDVLISTLAAAHIRDIETSFKEWNRVLKQNAGILLTDYHPVALERNASRTFRHQGKLISVKSYVHPLKKIRQLAEQNGWLEEAFMETNVDEKVKPYYAGQNALHVYESMKGTPIVFGFRFKKI